MNNDNGNNNNNINNGDNDDHLSEQFSQGVADLFITIEELKNLQKVKVIHPPDEDANSCITSCHDILQQYHPICERILSIVDSLYQWGMILSKSSNNTNTTHELLMHCLGKTILAVQRILITVCIENYSEPTAEQQQDDDNEDTPIVLDMDTIQLLRRDAQVSIARITEINLLILCMYNDSNTTAKTNNPLIQSPQEIVDSYVQYQRHVLRTRAKPSIAQLVQERRNGTFQNATNSNSNSDGGNKSKMVALPPPVIGGKIIATDDDDENDTTDEYDDETSLDNENNDDDDPKKAITTTSYQHYHGPVLTIILGEAATLIHPLATWMAHLPPPSQQQSSLNVSLYQLCHQSIHVLNEQTQTLVKTICDWFLEDQTIDTHWMPLIAKQDAKENATTNHKLTLRRRQLITLDGLLDEMAFSCQLLDRYQTLIKSTVIATATPNNDSNSPPPSTMIADQIIPEMIWKYSLMERYFAMQQWRVALKYAMPVTIVIGMDIRVPSVVEDGHYLSQRSFERSSSTHSKQAIGTVAYTICHDIWINQGTNIGNNSSTSEGNNPNSKGGKNETISIYQALLEERGCWKYTPTTEEIALEDERTKRKKMEELGKKNHPESAPNSGDFASALLSALDDELDSNRVHNNGPTNTKKKGKQVQPQLSGGVSGSHFLSSLVLSESDREKTQQRQLDTQFCVLNGIHAAHGACMALVELLDSLKEDDDDEHSNDNSDTAKATSMILLAREELVCYAASYNSFLMERLYDTIKSWCGSIDDTIETLNSKKKNTLQCFEKIALFFHNEDYELDGNKIIHAENEDRLELELINPFRVSRIIQQLTSKLEPNVLELSSIAIANAVVDIILDTLNLSFLTTKQQQQQTEHVAIETMSISAIKQMMMNKKQFTDWGAILLSTQIRMLQAYICTMMLTPSSLTTTNNGAKSASNVSSSYGASGGPGVSATTASTSTVVSPKLWQVWDRLSQIVTILQLERPSDWLSYGHHQASSMSSTKSSLLQPHELAMILSLRVDFSVDAIQNVISALQR